MTNDKWYKMIMKKLILFIVVVLSLGCDKSFNSIEEYQAYLNSGDYPYRQTEIRSGVKITLSYMPGDALLLNQYRLLEENKKRWLQDSTVNDMDGRIQQGKDEIEIQKKNYQQALYFKMTIGFEDDKGDIVFKKMQQGYKDYGEWFQRLAFGLKEHIFMKTESIAEVPLDIYHMERTFGMTKDRTFLLVFPKKFNEQELLQSEQIDIVLKEFGLGAGRIKMSFEPPFDNAKLIIDN